MQKKEDALKGVKLFVLDMDGTVYLGCLLYTSPSPRDS